MNNIPKINSLEAKAYTNADFVNFNRNQQRKIAHKRRDACKMADAIKGFLDKRGVPVTKGLKDDFNRDTGELFENEQYADLGEFYWKLKGINKSIYAVFQDHHTYRKDVQLMATWYSKHRLDPVWNFRKSQMIRKVYKDYIGKKMVHTYDDGCIVTNKNSSVVYTKDDDGDTLIQSGDNEFYPIEIFEEKELIKACSGVHIMLSVPHAGGLWQGKDFYAKELLGKFHEMRRATFWKRAIYGGEYGLEITKSPNGHGLHIHIHSLAFINPHYSINEVRDWIRERWHQLTGAQATWCDGLFNYKKNEKGQFILDTKNGLPYKDGKGEFVRKKFRVNGSSSLADYTKAVLETIKYHFKGDEMVKPSGEYDIPLMMDILKHSKRLRFYSRFGAFYKDYELDMDKLRKERVAPEGETDEEGEDVGLASAADVEQRVLNPFTNELDSNYRMAFCNPENLNYTSKKSRRPNVLTNYNDAFFLPIMKGYTLGEVIREMVQGNYRALVYGEKLKRKIAI